jgi:hypothetical protein
MHLCRKEENQTISFVKKVKNQQVQLVSGHVPKQG